jgi:hypothetical protein
MPVRKGTKEYSVMEELLEGAELPGVEMVERRRGGAKWFGIAHAFATNHRIIIVRIYPFGLRTSIKIIRYRDIIEVKVERGLFYCKIHFALQGEGPEADESKKWFLGLRYGEAVELIKFINRMGGVKPTISGS